MQGSIQEEQIVEGFLISLNQLIPNTDIRFVGTREESGTDEPGFGHVAVEGGVEIWFSHRAGALPLTFRIVRAGIGLTALEASILQRVPRAVTELGREGSFSFMGLSLKFSNKIGFGDILVAQFLDRPEHPAMHQHISILTLLQDLSFRYYEDKRCSSGMYVTKDPEAFIKKVGETNFTFYPFDEPIQLHHGFFGSPATFRYVDGRNSYYLIDDHLQIHGIMRLRNPDSYSLVARLRNQHLKPILSDMPGEPWVAFVGLKEEVYVVVNPELQIKWARNHWQLRDRSIMFSMLDRFRLKKDIQELFVSILFALSEGGHGASILIPDEETRLPESIGKIDHTIIGDQLRALIRKSSIMDLNATNSLLGIIGSDGLTTVSREGLILGCGDIIDISRAALLQSQGGGRSQAGIAASFFGLSIKISQNGPITFYHHGKLLLQF